MLFSRSLAAVVVLTCCLAPLAGCTICANTDDQAYPTYGGSWQRTDRFHGRVGSVFEPAGMKVAHRSGAQDEASLPSPEAVPLGQPTPADSDPYNSDAYNSDAPDDAAGDSPSDAELEDLQDLEDFEDLEWDELRQQLQEPTGGDEVSL